MEPKPIEPQDIRAGDRICIAWSIDGIDRTHTLTVAEVDLESRLVKAAVSGVWATLTPASGATITLLERAEPARSVGSRWLDPDTGAEYVKTDKGSKHDAQYLAYVRGREVGIDAALVPNFAGSDAEIIARLQPIPAFDPAALWPPADRSGLRCGRAARDSLGPITCSRGDSHAGPHVAYVDHAPGIENLRYVWGRP